jgi:phosphoglycerate dehydrogenase-like enzyme
MSSLTLLVIADPAALFLKPLSRLQQDIQIVVSDDPEKLKSLAADADAILFADFDGDLLANVLPLANRVRWIHCLWTGVEMILKPKIVAHPAPLTNGRGVFRWPLADWVIAAMLFFAFDLGRVIRQREQGMWKPFISTSLKGRVLGIVGFGSIGAAAAARARVFGMKIAALRRRPELLRANLRRTKRTVPVSSRN